MPSQSSHSIRSQRFAGLTGSLVLLGLQTLIFSAPGSAAENLKLKYGFFSPTLPVQDLRTYAETGKASPKLALLLGFAGPKRQDLILTSLQRKVAVEPEKLEQMLTSKKAQEALTEAAAATQHPDHSGVQALQTGLLEGSRDPQGLGLISFLEAYPGETLTIDVRKATEIAQENKNVLQDLRVLDTKSTAAKVEPKLVVQTSRQPTLFKQQLPR